MKKERRISSIACYRHKPGIIIAGTQVAEAGFEYNTPVRIEYEHGKITIHKVYPNGNIYGQHRLE